MHHSFRMTEDDDNSSWIFLNSSFEPKNWSKDDATNTTGFDSETTIVMNSGGESGIKDVTGNTKMTIPEDGTHILNTRGSSGNTTDVMDILSDPDRKKWPSEAERVEGESPQEPVERANIGFRMAKDDNNSSWIFPNSSAEPKNWSKDNATNTTGFDRTDSEDAFVEGKSATDIHGVITGASTAVKVLNDATDNALEVAREVPNVISDTALNNAAKVLNISGSETTIVMNSGGESGIKEVTGTTKMMIPEEGTHILNTGGSSGNTTDVMDILSEPVQRAKIDLNNVY